MSPSLEVGQSLNETPLAYASGVFVWKVLAPKFDSFARRSRNAAIRADILGPPQTRQQNWDRRKAWRCTRLGNLSMMIVAVALLYFA